MNTLEIVFDWMLAATVRASVLAAAILCVQLVLRRWLSAGWRHALWLPMLAVLVLPVLPTVPFGLFPAKEGPTAVSFAAPDVSIESPGGEAANVLPTHAGSTQTRWNVLASVWFVGACGVLTAGIVGYRETMRRVKRGAISADPSLLDRVAKAAREAGLSRAPRVIVSNAVESPAVTGLFRPVLLLPAGFPEGFNATEARLILLHECAHLKRFDLPMNWLSCFLQAMHWFNPVLWYAFARMRADRETACDAQVLSIDATDHRAAYGQALLKLQNAASPRALSLGFVGIFERSSEMKSRIHWISRHRPAPFASRAMGAALCTLLLMFGATRAEESPRPEMPKKQPGSKNTGAAGIVGKLRTLVIPRIDLENVTLDEAVDFIRLRSRELDKQEPDPARKGVNFVIRKPRPGADGNVVNPYGPIKMSLKEVPLEKVIKECAEQSGARYKVDDFSVIFVPVDEADIRPEPAAPAAKQDDIGTTRVTGKVADEANKIIIPKAEFGDVTLQEAVDYLNQQAKEIAKGKPAVLLVIDPKVDATVRIKELRLRNVPLAIAATYCAEKTRLRLVAGEKEIRFRKWGP